VVKDMLTTAQLKAREKRGKAIAVMKGQVQIFEETAFKVKSQSGNGTYEVLKMNPKKLFLMPHLVGRLLQQMELVILVKAEHDSVT
jgi:hypothetical protein